MRAIHMISLFFLLSLVAHSATYYVPDDYGSIQAAIDGVADGDTIIVRPGTYYENLIIPSTKAITLKSEQGLNDTRIHGDGSDTVVSCYSRSADTVFEGFHIRGGYGTDGGAMLIYDSDLTVNQCCFDGNDADAYGGGIYISGGSPTVSNCIFQDNECQVLGGGGMYMVNASPTITNCNFWYNRASSTYGGGMSIENSSPVITQCNFVDNQSYGAGGGIYNSDSAPIITNCYFSGNESHNSIGGAMCSYTSSFTVTNSIIWGNTPDNIRGAADVTYSCIEGGFTGTGNIDSYPNVRGFGSGARYLGYGSPCIDAGDNDAPHLPDYDYEGDDRILDGNVDGIAIVDMGPDEFSSPLPMEIWVDDDWSGYNYGNQVEGHTFGIDAHARIQDGIDLINLQGIVHVKDGTYVGEGNRGLDFNGKPFTLQSENGPDACIIDCEQAAGGFYFHNEEGADSVVDGFTIRNGDASYVPGLCGGGMCIMSASPTVKNCLFLENSSPNFGGGVFVFQSSPTLTDCTFLKNTAAVNGGGVLNMDYSSPTLNRCRFQENTTDGWGGGIFNHFSCSPSLLDCDFVENSASNGGGMANYDSSPELTNCVFALNTSSDSGGAMINDSSCSTIMTNCTLYGNTATGSGGGIYNNHSSSPTVCNSILWNDSPDEIVDAGGSATTVTCSCIQGGHAGTGNIDADPLFVDAANSDFHLTWNSPCRDVGDNSAVVEPTDFEGDPRIALSTMDMGADEYYYHLYHMGDVVPGSPIDIKVVGYPSAPVTLYLGSGLADPPHSTQHGDFYLNWPPLWQGNIGTVPGDGVLSFSATVPTGWMSGSEHPLQALVGPWNGPWTRLTNMEFIVVE